jgi:hypothetical protein
MSCCPSLAHHKQCMGRDRVTVAHQLERADTHGRHLAKDAAYLVYPENNDKVGKYFFPKTGHVM